MRISDWSSDVCSSDLTERHRNAGVLEESLGIGNSLGHRRGNIFLLIVSAVDLAAIEDHEAASKEAAATIGVVCGSGFVSLLALPQDDMGSGFTFTDPGIERLPLLKGRPRPGLEPDRFRDRKRTRLNSSH